MFYTKKELALKESAERKKGKRVFYLESDGWNDYGYETLFELYWTDEDNKFHEIGPVKIAHKSEKITRDLLENSFSRLEENFCSLGIFLNGIRYFCALSKEFVLITTNTRHPAFNVEDENLHIIYQNELSLKDALIKLKSEYGCERITIQTGGTLNNLFLREKLFDYVDIIIAPVLIGGKDTSTLIDGKSLTEECELSKLGVVKLQECVVLENSYLRLRYEVIH